MHVRGEPIERAVRLEEGGAGEFLEFGVGQAFEDGRRLEVAVKSVFAVGIVDALLPLRRGATQVAQSLPADFKQGGIGGGNDRGHARNPAQRGQFPEERALVQHNILVFLKHCGNVLQEDGWSARWIDAGPRNGFVGRRIAHFGSVPRPQLRERSPQQFFVGGEASEHLRWQIEYYLAITLEDQECGIPVVALAHDDGAGWAGHQAGVILDQAPQRDAASRQRIGINVGEQRVLENGVDIGFAHLLAERGRPPLWTVHQADLD